MAADGRVPATAWASRMIRDGRGFGAEPDESSRDDRVLLATRWVGRILVPALAVAFVILYGFPDRTAELFAWTINPPMTPLVMGAGYGTGAYFFYRVVTAEAWHRVGAVLPGIAVFTWFMAIATVLHWENFNHDHATFWIWAILYAASPIVVPVLWVRNDRTDPRGHADGTDRLPRTAQLLAIGSGVVISVGAAILFVVPELLVETWPWAVSPLTARILLGWFALFGVVNLTLGLDGRWSAARIPVQTEVLGFSLMLLAVARAWGDFDAANPATWAFLGGFVLYLGALVSLYSVVERR